MEVPIIDDELWHLIKPFLPAAKPRAKKHDLVKSRMPDRVTLNGLLFVLMTGIFWNYFLTQLGFGWAQFAGATRRLAEGWRVGSSTRVAARPLICRGRFIVGTRCRGRCKTDENPTNCARPDSKHHISL
ncbi:MAG: hypothetical protein E5299_00300 [Burkholderia gladioli]|nr:MAG: hypothetical protein E5299_00300 [Burkholderia gladioli]